MVLVDTCVWSLVLRRRPKDRSAEEEKLAFFWRDIVIRGEARLIGPIRQELLSGVSSPSAYANLREHLNTQIEIPLVSADWDLAAEFYNTCRGKGIVPEAADMTICAAAWMHGMDIFTTDPDFGRYAKHLPISLIRL